MRHLLFALILILPLLSSAQSVEDYAVQIEATTTSGSNPQIRLDWVPDPTTTTYKIWRKHPDSVSWGTVKRSQSGVINVYIDYNVNVGESYEYRVERTTPTKTVYGYVTAGMELPPLETRGKLLLVVDLAYASQLQQELGILTNDLEGDGWHVIRKDIHNAAPDTTVKNWIQKEYNKDRQNVKAVYLFGHLAVPYSGTEAFDGQINDHLGAWPTDTWYADLDGIWTDLQYSSNWFSYPLRTQNARGDGKWDQNSIPSAAELQVGRVDFSDLTFFSMNEWQLMKNYVIRSHEYKTNQWNVPTKALVVDSIGISLNQAQGAAAYRSFRPLVGNNIDEAAYRGTLNNNSYLMSYANGNGTFITLTGIGTSNQVSGDSLRSVFHLLHGEYLGDWDTQNNMLRALIAQGYGLSSFHTGNPEWQIHSLGLGESMGQCAKRTMNSSGVYDAGNWQKGVNISLMGDPTLRLHMISPASNFTATDQGNNRVQLNWTASTDPVLGYHIYRKKKYDDFFSRVNTEAINGTNYLDSCVVDSGDYVYMVRGLKLEQNTSGSYYNLSLGIFDSLTLNTAVSVNADFSRAVNGATASFTNSASTNNLLWDFGDGTTSSDVNPIHIYQKNGTYKVTQIAINACNSDSISKTLDIDFYRPLPLSNLSISDLGANQFKLDWNHSSSFVNGYNVWRREVPNGFFQILTTFGFWKQNYFNDSCLVTPGDYEYMVSGFKRDTFATGIKPNFSDSIKQVINITTDYTVTAGFSYTTNEDTLFLTNTSQFADSFIWDLDNGFRSSVVSPRRILGQNGAVTIKLKSIGSCGFDSISETISFQTIGLEEAERKRVRIHPNPSSGVVFIETDLSDLDWQVFSAEGKLIEEGKLEDAAVDLQHLNSGIYFMHLKSENFSEVHKLFLRP